MKGCGSTEECQYIIQTQCMYLNATDYYQMTDSWDDQVWFQYVVYGSSLMYAVMAFLIWKIKDL